MKPLADVPLGVIYQGFFGGRRGNRTPDLIRVMDVRGTRNPGNIGFKTPE